MSWLFGWWKGSGSPPAEEQTPAAPAEGGGRAPGGSGGDKQVDKWSNFDPTGLERAARAARELDKSRAYFLFTLLSFISPQFNQNPCFIWVFLHYFPSRIFLYYIWATVKLLYIMYFSDESPSRLISCKILRLNASVSLWHTLNNMFYQLLNSLVFGIHVSRLHVMKLWNNFDPITICSEVCVIWMEFGLQLSLSLRLLNYLHGCILHVHKPVWSPRTSLQQSCRVLVGVSASKEGTKCPSKLCPSPVTHHSLHVKINMLPALHCMRDIFTHSFVLSANTLTSTVASAPHHLLVAINIPKNPKV